MTNQQLNDYGHWVPAEPLAEPFGLRWERMAHHRRELGQGVIRAYIGGWRDVRAVERASSKVRSRSHRPRL